MEQYIFLDQLEATEIATEAAEVSIPQREATTSESLKLIGEGWGSIFIVILIMICVTMLLNKIFSKSK